MRNWLFILVIIVSSIFASAHSDLMAQSGSISFRGRNMDNGRIADLDSIFILNQTKDIGTMIYDGSNFNLGFFTSIDEIFGYGSELIVSQCYPSICDLATHINITTVENKDLHINILSLEGRKVISYSSKLDVGVHSFRIETGDLSTGIYVINVYSGTRGKSVRFVKSGAGYGNKCEVFYEGNNTAPGLLQKSVYTSIEDLYQFVGFSKDCVNDTLKDQIPDDGKRYWFSLTKGREAISDSCDSEYVWYDWKCYPKAYLTNWGMGETENDYLHNDQKYSWYIDQKNTGQHSANNCGPSSVTMAAMWSDSTFNKSTEVARETYRPDGGWWYTNNIIDYLNLNSIPNSTVAFVDSLQIQQIIKDSCILILCLNTAELRRSLNNEERVDRFYNYADGHFLVVKGVRTIDDILYCETYDPNNWGLKYYDKTEKGENRHYRYSDISKAVSTWWNYLIVVFPVGKGLKYKPILPNEVDSDTIIHNWGKG